MNYVIQGEFSDCFTGLPRTIMVWYITPHGMVEIDTAEVLMDFFYKAGNLI